MDKFENIVIKSSTFLRSKPKKGDPSVTYNKYKVVDENEAEYITWSSRIGEASRGDSLHCKIVIDKDEDFPVLKFAPKRENTRSNQWDQVNYGAGIDGGWKPSSNKPQKGRDDCRASMFFSYAKELYLEYLKSLPDTRSVCEQINAMLDDPDRSMLFRMADLFYEWEKKKVKEWKDNLS